MARRAATITPSRICTNTLDPTCESRRRLVTGCDNPVAALAIGAPGFAMLRRMLRLALLGLLGCSHPAHHHDGPPPAHHHDGMPHRFEHAEEWAKVFDDPSRDAWQQPDAVVAALELAPAMAVADVGAGTGYFTVRLARAVPQGQVLATDIEPDMVRYLAERAQREHLTNVTATLAGAADPKLAAGSVDRVLVVDVWHHIGDRVAYARGLAAALRPGGKVVIVDFTQEATHGPPKHHRLTPEAIVADLRAAGLDAVVSPTRLPEQYIVVGTRS
jgi:SAM-dependent methyltransferase